MIAIGIDPGVTGALAVLRDSGAAVCDLPVLSSGKGTVKREIDAAGLASFLAPYEIGVDVGLVLERTSAMPGQGVASMFSMGVSRGIVLGVAGALRLPLREVVPAVWKKHFGLIGADKDMSRRIAVQRFPALAPQLARVKDHNRAEALLLALWLREQY